MTAPKPNKILTLPVALIVAIGPRRQLDEAKICALMESIRSIGLLNPIVVMRPEEVGCDTVRLVWGLHRLEAIKRLGYPTIQCAILESKEALRTELDECDEEITRGNPSAAKHALLTGQRTGIMQELAAQKGTLSEFTAGSKRAFRRGGGKSGHVASVRDQAKRTGESEDKVRRSKNRYEILGIRLLHKIVSTTLDSCSELDALARLSEVEREGLADRAASGARVTARMLGRQPKPKIEGHGKRRRSK